MSAGGHMRGACVGVLNRMDAWEANLVLMLRLWCAGPAWPSEVWDAYRRALPGPLAKQEYAAFEGLLALLIDKAHRKLVRHDVACACVGSDEAILAHFVKTAADGHLSDAALIATLMVGPAHAEHAAVLAGQVGSCLRRMHAAPQGLPPMPASTSEVRLHERAARAGVTTPGAGSR